MHIEKLNVTLLAEFHNSVAQKSALILGRSKRTVGSLVEIDDTIALYHKESLLIKLLIKTFVLTKKQNRFLF